MLAEHSPGQTCRNVDSESRLDRPMFQPLVFLQECSRKECFPPARCGFALALTRLSRSLAV